MTKAKFTGKVIEQFLFFSESEKIEVPTVEITPDTTGYYYIKAIGNKEQARRWRRGWEELEINKVEDGLYRLSFYDFSAPQHGLRSKKAFLVIEMTKEEVCHWHENDVWFAEDIHYFVRRKGKKFTGKGNNRRCIKCRYSQTADATECDRGC